MPCTLRHWAWRFPCMIVLLWFGFLISNCLYALPVTYDVLYRRTLVPSALLMQWKLCCHLPQRVFQIIIRLHTQRHAAICEGLLFAVQYYVNARHLFRSSLLPEIPSLFAVIGWTFCSARKWTRRLLNCEGVTKHNIKGDFRTNESQRGLGFRVWMETSQEGDWLVQPPPTLTPPRDSPLWWHFDLSVYPIQGRHSSWSVVRFIS